MQPLPSLSLAQWHLHPNTVRRYWIPLHQHLLSYIPELATIQAAEVASYISALIKFQDEHLGRSSTSTTVLRIPGKVLKDFSTNGGLVNVVRCIYHFKASQGWKKPDFTRKDKVYELVRYIYDVVSKSNLIVPPRIYWAQSMTQDRQKQFYEYLRSLNAIIVRDVKECTHIIEDWKDSGEEGGTWLRTLEKVDGMALVHYWYTPDSADLWMIDAHNYADPEPPPKHKGPWRVSAKWIRDGALFNEWMNEEDYEVEEPAPESKPHQHVHQKHVQSPQSQQSKKPLEEANSDDGDHSQDERCVMDEEYNVEYGDYDEDEERGDDDDEDGEEHDVDDLDYGSNRRNHSKGGGSKQARANRSIDDDDFDKPSRRSGAAKPRVNKVKFLANLRAQARTGPKPYPRLTFQNMNDRIWSQAKRWEWEPVADGLFRNISQCIYTRNLGTRHMYDLSQPETWDVLLEKVSSSTNIKTKRSAADDSVISWEGDYRIVVPSMTHWFSLNTIHDIEKTAFADVFNPPPVPEPILIDGYEIPPEEEPMIINDGDESTYRMVRDYIVHTYRRRPIEYLPISECLSADAKENFNLAYRLHAFLERWGIINYQAVMYPAELRDDPTRSAPLGSLVYRSISDLSDEMKMIYTSASAENHPPFSIPPHNTTVTSAKHHCMSCGKICYFISYISLEYVATEYCESCYLDGKYSSFMQSNRFARLELPALYPDDDDSDEDSVLNESDGESDADPVSQRAASCSSSLSNCGRGGSTEPVGEANGSQRHGTYDWDAVSIAMGGTKSKEACMKKFLRASLDEEKVQLRKDILHDLDDDAGWNEWEQEFRSYVPLLLGSGVDNPLMNLIRVLSSAISPQVAAAASRGAMSKILRLRLGGDDSGKGTDQDIEYSQASDDMKMRDGIDPSCADHIADTSNSFNSNVAVKVKVKNDDGTSPSHPRDLATTIQAHSPGNVPWVGAEVPSTQFESPAPSTSAVAPVRADLVVNDESTTNGSHNHNSNNNNMVDDGTDAITNVLALTGTLSPKPNPDDDILLSKLLPDTSDRQPRDTKKGLRMTGSLQAAMAHALAEARALAKFEEQTAQTYADELYELQLQKIGLLGSVLEALK
ncbi:hypothetical protein SeMB42_g04546 [Synchytrium endobioticum]|uniref:Uncharacterized protein n=1 Tax=Synchytrium endobioticum TaxID=286115 RepID=A0A507CXI8_9FUNG|nr:hypothetical protein SeMB42_g04546 [Synchytrium endobioticum]